MRKIRTRSGINGRWAFWGVLAMVAAFCAGSVWTGRALAADPAGPAAIQAASRNDDRAGYRIGAGDVLEITTWKEPDFSTEVLVRLDGFVSFPLLDDIAAAGMTPMDLKALLTEKLARFVEGPQVTVTVKDPASKKFYILGEVVRTGEYPLHKELTVLQAFALAGGFTQWASKKEILLLRKEMGQDRVFRINYKAIVGDQDLSGNLKLQANDTIVVP